MVALCTVHLTLKKNPTFCPHSVYMCFIWIWIQTTIIVLYSINWLFFFTEHMFCCAGWVKCTCMLILVTGQLNHCVLETFLHLLSGGKFTVYAVVCLPFRLNNAFPNIGSASSLIGAWWSRKCSKSFTVTIFISSGSRSKTVGIINWYTPPYLFPFNLLYM